jgi:uncharacterized protein
MKANRLRWLLLFLLLWPVLRIPAQQSEADRKLLADIRAKAEKGDAEAQYALGVALNFGTLGVAEDYVEAVKWFRKAAEQDNADAQYNLGQCFVIGEGVGKDFEEAAKWFRKAAEQQSALAQFSLGVCYDKGLGVAQDDATAFTWYRSSAIQGFAPAQFNVGQFCRTGRGVAPDHFEAAKWFRKAADQGLATAQCGLGYCYINGAGVPKDVNEASKWYRKAAEKNDAQAQYDLGLCCANGEGVPKDYVDAYKWWSLSAGQANADAEKYLSILKDKLTQKQISDGETLVRNFKPQKSPSIWTIHSDSALERAPVLSGTGFFITVDGYFVTCNHLVTGAAKVRLVTDAGLISAKEVKVDVANDLALLKAEGVFAPLSVVSSRTMRMGTTVATVGFPNIGLQGFAPKLAKGEIAALSGVQDDPKYFQISAPVQPGNSGGALVDEHGNVVGVVAAKLDEATALAASGALPENVNYAVKSSFLLSFLESVPEVSAKLNEPNTSERKFEDVVSSAERAAVLVLVY